jgi:hypothetical protein
LRQSPAIAVAVGIVSPLVLLHLIGGSHNDALMMGLLAVGVAAFLRKHKWLGLALVVAATAAKVPAAAGIVFLGWNWHDDLDTPIRDRVRTTALAGIGSVAAISVMSVAVGISVGWMGALKSTGTVYSTFSVSTKLGFLTVRGKTVEADETWIGGKARSMNAKRRKKAHLTIHRAVLVPLLNPPPGATRKGYEEFIVQGLVFEASAYAAPFLLALVQEESVRQRARLLWLLALLAADLSFSDPRRTVHTELAEPGTPEYRAREMERGWVRAAHEAVGAGHLWNVVSPSSSPRGRPAARWSPMGRRIEDEGRSERHPVVGWIGVESSDKITLRQSGLTSLWSFVTREPGKPLQEASR